MKRVVLLMVLFCVLLALFAFRERADRVVTPAVQRLRGKKTVADRVAEFGPTARRRWAPHFERAGVSYPPAGVVLVGLKAERRLQVYAGPDGGPYRLVRALPVLGASGGPGPKLREGDCQVPEGIYRIESLNPNSAYHLSLRIGYPNDWDREMARRDGRQQLGSDIMIHGGTGSIGCLAMGDEAAEDLFVLAAETGIESVRVIIAPRDLRRRGMPRPGGAPEWAGRLYDDIRAELQRLPLPG